MTDYPKIKEKLENILSSLGLRKNEISIYLDLIRVNSSSPLEISRRTKIHRSNVYDSLRKLLEMGLVRELLEENRHLYVATDPEKIKDYLEQKEQELDSIKGELKTLPRHDPKEEKFTISEGKFAARQALEDLLKLNSTIYASGASSEAVEGFGKAFLEEFHKERIAKKILMKHVYNKLALKRVERLNKLEYTEARYLPDRYGTIAATVVCADTVVIFIFNSVIRVIKIEDSDIADSYRKNFDLLYKISKN